MSRIVAAALLSLIGAPALAADLPMKAPPAPPPILSWTGCYAGVHVGAGSIDSSRPSVSVNDSNVILWSPQRAVLGYR